MPSACPCNRSYRLTFFLIGALLLVTERRAIAEPAPESAPRLGAPSATAVCGPGREPVAALSRSPIVPFAVPVPVRWAVPLPVVTVLLLTTADVPSVVAVAGRASAFAKGTSVGPSFIRMSERDRICAGAAWWILGEEVSGMRFAGSGPRTTIGEVVLGGKDFSRVVALLEVIRKSAGLSSRFGGSMVGRSVATIDFCVGAGVMTFTGSLGGVHRSASGTGVGLSSNSCVGASG